MFEGNRVQLPFDAKEVIDYLTREQYIPNASEYPGNLIRQLYYGLRPVLPLNLRSELQRIYLQRRKTPPFPVWPVDTTVDDLMKKLLLLRLKASGMETMPFIWFWPDNAAAAAIMTHDIEAREGKQYSSQLMDIDEEFGVSASFQVVPEQRYEVNSRFIEEIKARQFEVNVQDLNHDGRLFWNYEEFTRRAVKINGYGREFGAAGFRSAILYRRQDWFDLLDFEYDMSVPNVARFDPQPGGCCTVMPYFIGKMLELPVTTSQDHTLFHHLRTYSIDLWRTQISSILEKHGLISFIVHPDYVIEPRAQSAYKELLTELNELRSSKNVWLTCPGEVNRWWRQRSAMKLVPRNGELTIEGEGSDRASIAFASIENDEIAYTLPDRQLCS